MNSNIARKLVILIVCSTGIAGHAGFLESEFNAPPNEYRPETWFHLIGGNVGKLGLSADLEAISAAGIDGIQLFHGSGSPWPNIMPQITALSPSWDDMIAHVADETRRLELRFTMGWAMTYITSRGRTVPSLTAIGLIILIRMHC